MYLKESENKKMFGFSIYLNHDLTAADYDYLLAMHNAGFSTVFTSLNIPEDDPSLVLKRLKKLTKWCENLETALIADVSKEGFHRLGIAINELTEIESLHLTGLRIDAGADYNTIAKLSKIMPIALNASTITESDIAGLRSNNANFQNLQAWHNYYPRPETGLSAAWLQEKNTWLHRVNLQTMAFIPGDKIKRGPIYAGLPTLEKHRNNNPLASVLELKQLGCDHIFVGDASLSDEAITTFAAFLKHDAVTLHVADNLSALFDHEWHNRPDAARDVIRLTEGRIRRLFNVEPQEKIMSRPKGTITSDNTRYLRYQGELQITKRDLPADKRVNVLTKVVATDLPLLDQINAGQKIVFRPVK